LNNSELLTNLLNKSFQLMNASYCIKLDCELTFGLSKFQTHIVNSFQEPESHVLTASSLIPRNLLLRFPVLEVKQGKDHETQLTLR
jgi:hypothetical protein